MANKLINPHAYKEWLQHRILGFYETDCLALASVAEACLDNLSKEIYACNNADRFSGKVFFDPSAHEKYLKRYAKRLRKLDVPAAEAIVNEALAKLREQPDISAELPSPEVKQPPIVSREEYETMRADRDSWKDAFGECNEKVAKEVTRREAAECENKRLRTIIVKHLPGDNVCACCQHFERCKQESLEENEVVTQHESIFWNCDGYNRFVPKKEE